MFLLVIPACDGMTATGSDQGEGWRMSVAPFIRAGRMYAWGGPKEGPPPTGAWFFRHPGG